jgi:hypothetical protein
MSGARARAEFSVHRKVIDSFEAGVPVWKDTPHGLEVFGEENIPATVACPVEDEIVAGNDHVPPTVPTLRPNAPGLESGAGIRLEECGGQDVAGAGRKKVLVGTGPG